MKQQATNTNGPTWFFWDSEWASVCTVFFCALPVVLKIHPCWWCCYGLLILTTRGSPTLQDRQPVYYDSGFLRLGADLVLGQQTCLVHPCTLASRSLAHMTSCLSTADLSFLKYTLKPLQGITSPASSPPLSLTACRGSENPQFAGRSGPSALARVALSARNADFLANSCPLLRNHRLGKPSGTTA